MYFGQAQCNSEAIAHYNVGDFPFTSSSGVVVTMSGTNGINTNSYGSFGCSPATVDSNSIRLNAGDDLTLMFSQTIYEISVVIGLFNFGENGTVTTNNGIPSLSADCPSTHVSMTGNAFENVKNDGGHLTNTVLTITIPNGATSLTINNVEAPVSYNIFGIDVLDCISTATLDVYNVEALHSKNVSITPNPSKDFIQISNLDHPENYKIFNTLGIEFKSGIASDKEKINIQRLNKGMYIFKLENGNALKFIKEY